MINYGIWRSVYLLATQHWHQTKEAAFIRFANSPACKRRQFLFSRMCSIHLVVVKLRQVYALERPNDDCYGVEHGTRSRGPTPWAVSPEQDKSIDKPTILASRVPRPSHNVGETTDWRNKVTSIVWGGTWETKESRCRNSQEGESTQENLRREEKRGQATNSKTYVKSSAIAVLADRMYWQRLSQSWRRHHHDVQPQPQNDIACVPNWESIIKILGTLFSFANDYW